MRISPALAACVWVILFSHPIASLNPSLYESQTAAAPAFLEGPAVITGIRDIHAFLEKCPNEDTIYPRLKQDFQVLLEGQPVTPDLNCTGLVSALPLEQLTNPFVAWQAFRTIYYMSLGTQGHLPWTEKSLYDWMASSIGGINFKTAPGQAYCCDLIDGKWYIGKSLNTYTQYESFFDWSGISNTISFYAHETRHANPDAPGHVTGCPDFPNPDGPAGCDKTYDLGNLGAYGVQYWLESQWATGFLNVGIGCLPAATAKLIVEQHGRNANSDRGRFVENPPAEVTAAQPYGGFCIVSRVSLPLLLR